MEVNNSAYLEINVGPMFSGKTSKLIEIYKKYSYRNIKVLPVNHISDNRYSDTMLSSHDKNMIPCVKTSLAPGSKEVSDYLEKAGLNKYLDERGINLVRYG